MKIFSQLLGKANKSHKRPLSPSEKQETLSGKSAEELEAIVLGRLGTPTDLELRLFAVERLESPASLFTLANRDDLPPPLEKRLRERVAQLIGNGTIEAKCLVNEIADIEKALAIAALCQNSDIESLVLASVNETDVLVDLCEKASASLARQAIVARIDDQDALRQLAKEFKQKDKNVYKLIKSRLDSYKAEAQEIAAREEKVESLLAESQSLAQRMVDVDYPLKLERLKRHQQELAGTIEEQQAKAITEVLALCEEKADAYLKQKEKEKEQEALRSQLGDHIEEALQELWQQLETIYSLNTLQEETLSQERSKLAALQERWQNLKSLGKTKEKHHRIYSLLVDGLQLVLSEYEHQGTMQQCRQRLESDSDYEQKDKDIRYLRRLLNPVTALKDDFGWGAVVNDALQLLESQDKDYAAREEENKNQLRFIGGLIKKASQSAEDGRLKRALGIRHSIDEKSQKLDGLPVHMQRQLENLDEAIEKLIDWQAYAVVPKKKELIEEMRGLTSSDMPAEALATKIKNLQDEWKELAQNGPERSEDLWQEFSQLADTAFEPCREHFKKLADIRKANLEKRQGLVDQLNDFYENCDWENADWRNVEKIVRTARKELMSYVPVERAENKIVLEKFDAALDRIQQKLHGEYDKNKAAKEQLITQAEKLPEMQDLNLAIDGAKRLQAQWKTIGRCHHRDHEKLWKAFRKQCDRVFEKKDQEFKQQKAQTDEKIDQARALVDDAQALSNKSGEELLAARTDREVLLHTFSSLEGVPEKVYKAIERDLNKAITAFDRKVENQLKAVELDAWQDFFALCEKINVVDLSVADGQAITEAAESELKSQVQAASHWPEGMKSAVQTKLESLKAAGPSPEKDTIKQGRLLCVRAEILAGNESPSEDKALRMEYQVNMLQQGMGGQLSVMDNRVELAKAWLEAGPLPEEAYQKLYQRFYQSWRQL